MTKLQTWLSGLLLTQLLIAAALFWGGLKPQQENQGLALLSFNAEQLERILISDGEHSVTLTKSGDDWRIPALQKLPADADKLESLLDKLHDLKSGWPVATTTSSHQRFEVAEDKFQRRLQLYQGDTLAGELYIGTASGFRQSHIRRAGDNAVYSAKLNSFDWPAKKQDWLDKSLLAVSKIKRIKGPDYQLQQQEPGWHFMATEDAEDPAPELNQEKARQLAAALRNLRVLAATDQAPDLQAAGTDVISLEVSGPQSHWRYRFINADGKYYVSRDDRETNFTLSQFDYDRIAAIDLNQLTEASPEAAEQSTETPEGKDDR